VREGSEDGFEGVSSAEHSGVVELLADDHQANRETDRRISRWDGRGCDGHGRHDEHVVRRKRRVVGGGQRGLEIAGLRVVRAVVVVQGVLAAQRHELDGLGERRWVPTPLCGVVCHQLRVVETFPVQPVGVALDHLSGGALDRDDVPDRSTVLVPRDGHLFGDVAADASRWMARRTIALTETSELAWSNPSLTTPIRSGPPRAKLAMMSVPLLLALLDRVVAEARSQRGDALLRLEEGEEQGWRDAIGAFCATFSALRAVASAGAATIYTSPAVQGLWSQVMEQFVVDAATAIESERRHGAAPDGIPARDLATSLNWIVDRVLSTTFLGQTPAVPEERLLDTLVSIYMGAIYHRLDG